MSNELTTIKKDTKGNQYEEGGMPRAETSLPLVPRAEDTVFPHPRPMQRGLQTHPSGIYTGNFIGNANQKFMSRERREFCLEMSWLSIQMPH